MEAESLPRISTSTTSFSTKTVEPYIVDFVSTADHRISSLNNEVTQLKEELFLSNEYIETLKLQVRLIYFLFSHVYIATTEYIVHCTFILNTNLNTYFFNSILFSYFS